MLRGQFDAMWRGGGAGVLAKRIGHTFIGVWWTDGGGGWREQRGDDNKKYSGM